MAKNTDFKCCICGAGTDGCTVHDFYMDSKESIDWQFCPNHSLAVGVRMIMHNLSKEQFKQILKLAGSETFMIHDDFYNGDGAALQPHCGP